MEIVPHKTPLWLKQLHPKRTWDYAETLASEKVIYLSFDDGPIPEVTPWVLQTLKAFQAKASFFCIGENLQKHPEIAKQVLAEEHGLGNHTFHHVNGWKTSFEDYSKEVTNTESIFEKLNIETKLFRPPYGKMTSKQADFVFGKEYNIIMWDVLTKDYNANLNAEKLLQNSIKATTSGSIIVFHDSKKAFKNLTYLLPKYLQHFSELGYTFKKI
jgi:peptidoglycan/xylan/chitin deacetylase (PgdA/CDA1 family)